MTTADVDLEIIPDSDAVLTAIRDLKEQLNNKLLELFEQIEPNLIRYPAIDPADFRRAVESTIAGA